MKKFILTALIVCFGSAAMNAQEVFKEMVQENKTIADDRSKDLEVRKIATFKYDALSYMAMKVRDDVLADTTNMDFAKKIVLQLNEQSLSLHEFVNLYVKRLTAAPKKKDKEVVMALFKNASLANPFYNDEDYDLVRAYCDNNNFITQFSLDTNWVKALEQVTRK